MKIVIIGLGSAGFAAALAAKKQDRNAEIVIIDKKDYDLVHPCGLPFYLEGKIKDINSLRHNLGLDRMNIKKHDNSEVIGIDVKDKKVIFKDKKANINTERYNKLIIAIGARPFVPPIPGIENAYKALDIKDVEKIKSKLENTKKAVIIGAGAIGLEKAIALKENGIKVTIIDIMKNILPNLIDLDISSLLEGYLKEEGIDVMLGKSIKKIEKDRVVMEDASIEVDMIILAAGVRPNLELLDDMQIEKERGIIVDERMQTSIKDVYAAGDCIQSVSLINKKTFSALLATTAYKQGTIAGINAAGGKIEYDGSLGTFVSKIGSMEIAATGFNSEFAKKSGYEIVMGKAKAAIKPDWFPGSKKLTLKIVAEKGSGKILGAQAMGEEGAASRINVISTAIKSEMTLKELIGLELAYCPAVSDVKDVLLIAAELALRKIR